MPSLSPVSYREDPIPRSWTKKKSYRGAVVARSPFARGGLALQPIEHHGLENLLKVPPRLWTKDERKFVKGVLHSLRRAVCGKVGYGEVASAAYGLPGGAPLGLDEMEI